MSPAAASPEPGARSPEPGSGKPGSGKPGARSGKPGARSPEPGSGKPGSGKPGARSGYRLRAQGSRLKVQGSRLKAHCFEPQAQSRSYRITGCQGKLSARWRHPETDGPEQCSNVATSIIGWIYSIAYCTVLYIHPFFAMSAKPKLHFEA